MLAYRFNINNLANEVMNCIPKTCTERFGLVNALFSFDDESAFNRNDVSKADFQYSLIEFGFFTLKLSFFELQTLKESLVSILRGKPVPSIFFECPTLSWHTIEESPCSHNEITMCFGPITWSISRDTAENLVVDIKNLLSKIKKSH